MFSAGWLFLGLPEACKFCLLACFFVLTTEESVSKIQKHSLDFVVSDVQVWSEISAYIHILQATQSPQIT